MSRAHRQVSLVIGRCEGNGIRCLFHGWKFAVDGTVMETPNVPDPTFKTRVRAKAYPVNVEPGSSVVKGPYVAETLAVSVESDYVVVDL